MTDAFVYDHVRTPRGRGKPDGSLHEITPIQLGTQVLAALRHRNELDTALVDDVVFGCVAPIGEQGSDIARVAALNADYAQSVAGQQLNRFCASGLEAVNNAAAQVMSGQSDAVIGGGVESMSRVPFMADNADYYRDAAFPPRTRYVPVALAADRLAEDERIGRDALDAAALRSQQRAAAAERSEALQRSRIAIRAADGTIALAHDECVRAGTTAEALAAMPPAFAELADTWREALGRRIDHRHTVAHAPPITDGAGLTLVAREARGGTRPRARILAYAEAGGDPQAGLLAGFTAMDRVLARAKLTLGDIDRIEFMEAFAVTIAKFLRDRDVDPARVNVAGGHLAKGHPMGASGAILVSSLLDVLDAADARTGLVVASGASGIGAALVVERG